MAKQVPTSKENSKPIMFNPARELSQLERLPNELIQMIFLQSLNLNLPRASPTLGVNLSSSHIKMLLVTKAFSSDSQYCLENSADLLDILHSKQEIAKLQTAILGLKWMTLEFLRQHIRIFFIKTILSRFLELNLDWRNGLKPTEATVKDLVDQAYGCTVLGREGGFLGLKGYAWDIGNDVQVTLEMGLRDGLVMLQVTTANHDCECVTINRYRWRLLLCLENCQIPNKLLHGPWTDAKCDFLEIVTRNGASIDWLNTTSGEVADLGLMEALLEPKPRVVELLVARPKGSGRYGSEYFDRTVRINQRYVTPRTPKETDTDLSMKVCRMKYTRFTVGMTPRTEHLRVAVLQGVFNQRIVSHLLLAKDSEINLLDLEVGGWALRNKNSGNKMGRWLYELLADLRKHADESGSGTSDSSLSSDGHESSDGG